MKTSLFRLVDRLAIRLAAAKMPRPDGRGHRLAEALALIASPEFIPEKCEPAKIEFVDAERFEFDSPFPTIWPRNNRVVGKLYRCGADWQKKPVVMLSHGWNDLIHHAYRFPKFGRQLNHHGYNAVTLEAPFHFHRRPRELGAGSNFLSPDILRTVQAAQQAISETRACARWLRQQGCPRVGLMGVSLGGWLGGLTICHDNIFDCAVLMVPVARMDRLLETASFCEGLRPAWAGGAIASGKLNLTENRPVIPRENVLLIEAIHDEFVARESMEELWKAWGEPEIWRMNHAHISVTAAWGLFDNIIRWLEPRLAARALK